MGGGGGLPVLTAPRGDPAGTALPSAGHLPTTIQMANRTQVPALSCTISRILTKMLKIGRSGRKGTCEGQELPCQL